MENIAIIGAGISGLCTAHLLKEQNRVTLFEKESTPGGLIRCEKIEGSLFHTCGGHIFNSKRKDVLDWFWDFFDRENEFTKAERNSVIYFNKNRVIPYPIENHMYLFDQETQLKFIDDLLSMVNRSDANEVKNFGDFLLNQFGKTLYQLYFEPYNEKIWRVNLNDVPISWLEGKLPMPSIQEMIYNNMNHVEEKTFVHSTFWYEKINGSQYVANKLAEGLDIKYNAQITEISTIHGKWFINGEEFDKVVFCGNIIELPDMLSGIDISEYKESLKKLKYHGTTTVFCEIDRNPFSWIYLPDKACGAHRIICTGNFSKTNNAEGIMTASVEFTDEISMDDIVSEIGKIPFVKRYIHHKYNKYTYPIQNNETRNLINKLKHYMAQYDFFFTGRFADWEYYNMDVAIGAAMDMCNKYIRK